MQNPEEIRRQDEACRISEEERLRKSVTEFMFGDGDVTGKTVASVVYKDPWDTGLVLVFTDGTRLQVREQTQSGQIIVTVNNVRIKSEEDLI